MKATRLISAQNHLSYLSLLIYILFGISAQAQSFKVVGFYTARLDAAHISFVHEANTWFFEQSKKHGFTYDSTNDWNNMSAEFLSRYDVVIFLDTRPDSAAWRAAFKEYMDKGGHSAFTISLPRKVHDDRWNHYNDLLCGSDFPAEVNIVPNTRHFFSTF